MKIGARSVPAGADYQVSLLKSVVGGGLDRGCSTRLHGPSTFAAILKPSLNFSNRLLALGVPRPLFQQCSVGLHLCACSTTNNGSLIGGPLNPVVAYSVLPPVVLEHVYVEVQCWIVGMIALIFAREWWASFVGWPSLAILVFCCLTSE